MVPGGDRWIDAVLCDRDGTLVVDVPYNRDPTRVRPMPTVRDGLARLRTADIATGIVSNQSGVARGLLSEADVVQVTRRVDELLGPFDVILWCPHGPDDGCRCRKPAPGMVVEAADRLGVDVTRCVVIGDIAADMGAAQAAGAWGILVPTAVTRPEEVAAAPCIAPTFAAAVDLVLAGGPDDGAAVAAEPAGRSGGEGRLARPGP